MTVMSTPANLLGQRRQASALPVSCCRFRGIAPLHTDLYSPVGRPRSLNLFLASVGGRRRT